MNLLDQFSAKTVTTFGHEGSVEFYRRLREDREVCCTRCLDCGSRSFPPRSFCADCFHDEVEWVPVSGGATLYAFTTQARALRFATPAVIGVVEIPDMGFLLAPIAGTMDELTIGQALTPEVIDVGDGLIFYRYVPVS